MRSSRPAVPAVTVSETPRQMVARLQELVVSEVEALLAGIPDAMERIDAAYEIEKMCRSAEVRAECCIKQARIDLGLVVPPGTPPTLMAQVLADSPESLNRLPDLLTLNQVAVILRVSRNTVYRMAQEHKIPVLRPGGKLYRVPRAPFLKYLESVNGLPEE